MIDRPRPSLGVFLLGFTLFAGAVVSLAMIVAGEQRLRQAELQVLKDIAVRRANAASMLFARAIWNDWRDVETVARAAANMTPEARRAVFDQVVGKRDRVSWAGFAALDGTVESASGGMLEGVSIGDRSWFRAGVEGPYAGGVREAVLLNELLPPANRKPLRVIDLAAPVPGEAGKPVGVVGFQLSQSWANVFLEETARIVGIEAVIVDREGRIVVGPGKFLTLRLPLPSLRAAAVGAPAFGIETWPDGTVALSVVTPSLGYSNLPAFGWSLVARIDATEVAGARKGVSRSLLAFLTLASVVLLAATALFYHLFIRPLGRLAEDAEHIARGDNIYPLDCRRSSELARLSSALVRIQSARSEGSAASSVQDE